MKKLFLLFLIFFSVAAQATALDICLQKISLNDNFWQERLFNKKNGIFNTLGDQEKLTDEMVQKNKAKIYTLLAGNILLNCNKDLANIEEQPRGLIYFKHDTNNYAFDFSTKTLFDYMEMRTGILVINKKNLSHGDVLELSSLPKNKKFFSDKCSDHTIWDNLDDDAAVNIAGQAVFNEYGGSKNEFFLDFAEGDNRRAFPGLVLMDKTWSTKETIVTYRNINTGLEKTRLFASKLKNSACSNQDLAVYSVILDVKRDTSSEKKGWAIAAGIGGGTMAWIGLSAGAVALPLAATASLPVIIGNAMLSTAAAATSVPGWGWIVAGVAIAGATAISLYPSEIEKIDQVMILDGPYNL